MQASKHASALEFKIADEAEEKKFRFKCPG